MAPSAMYGLQPAHPAAASQAVKNFVAFSNAVIVSPLQNQLPVYVSLALICSGLPIWLSKPGAKSSSMTARFPAHNSVWKRRTICLLSSIGIASPSERSSTTTYHTMSRPLAYLELADDCYGEHVRPYSVSLPGLKCVLGLRLPIDYDSNLASWQAERMCCKSEV
jgi:hypothetical protein